MVQSLGLLDLPRELRDQIWTLSFANHHVTPYKSALNIRSNCATCQSLVSKPPKVVSYPRRFNSLLVNKQVYSEALDIFSETLTLHTSSIGALNIARTSGRRNLNAKIRSLTLYAHLNDETRYHWMPELLVLGSTFPGLQKLTVHNHMRAPTNYDRLVDAIYLLGPLITLPTHLRPSTVRAGTESLSLGKSGATTSPEAIEASTSSSLSESANPPSNAAIVATTSTTTSTSTTSPAQPQTEEEPSIHQYRSEELNPNLVINFAYCSPEVLFESPFIGTISTTDAIDEHEAVLRDCLVNAEFRHMAEMRDLNGMTVTLLTIAREHEQTWLEGLHRRHMGGDFMQADMGVDVDHDGHGNEDDDDDDDDDDEDGGSGAGATEAA